MYVPLLHKIFDILHVLLISLIQAALLNSIKFIKKWHVHFYVDYKTDLSSKKVN